MRKHSVKHRVIQINTNSGVAEKTTARPTETHLIKDQGLLAEMLDLNKDIGVAPLKNMLNLNP